MGERKFLWHLLNEYGPLLLRIRLLGFRDWLYSEGDVYVYPGSSFCLYEADEFDGDRNRCTFRISVLGRRKRHV